VDEVIYFSGRKVDSIIERDRAWWRRLRARKVSAGVNPGVVKLEADIEFARPDKLEALAAKLDKVDKLGEDVLWFDDPALTAGDLMWFEGRIGCQLVTLRPGAGAVLFCQLPEPGRRAVVLHGSAANLLQRQQLGPVPGAPIVPYSDPSSAPDIVQAAIIESEQREFWKFWHDLGRDNAPAAADTLAPNLSDLYTHVVGTEWFRGSAPYLGGFAYVSGIVPLSADTEVVLGSPLYVKRMRPGY